MYKHFFKRVFDITVCLIGLPFFLIAFIFLAPVIKLTDGGPVFYNAERLGRRGKVFKMYKFRSMRVNSPNLLNADGSTYNGENDPRVTKIGRIMRKTSLDEIPQLFNVLFGHMSLIGPRAHLTTNYKGYEALDDVHKRRLDVRPGITGYNQAYFRNSVTSEQKLINDVYYVDNLSFMLDVKVFFKTIVSVLKRDNIYVSQEKPAAASTEPKEVTAEVAEASSEKETAGVNE